MASDQAPLPGGSDRVIADILNPQSPSKHRYYPHESTRKPTKCPPTTRRKTLLASRINSCGDFCGDPLHLHHPRLHACESASLTFGDYLLDARRPISSSLSSSILRNYHLGEH